MVVRIFPFIKIMKLGYGHAAAPAGTVYLLWPIYGIYKNHGFFSIFFSFLNNYESHLSELWQECVNGPILTSDIFFQKRFQKFP